MASLHLGTNLELFLIVVQVRDNYKHTVDLESFVVVWRAIQIISEWRVGYFLLHSTLYQFSKLTQYTTRSDQPRRANDDPNYNAGWVAL